MSQRNWKYSTIGLDSKDPETVCQWRSLQMSLLENTTSYHLNMMMMCGHIPAGPVWVSRVRGRVVTRGNVMVSVVARSPHSKHTHIPLSPSHVLMYYTCSEHLRLKWQKSDQLWQMCLTSSIVCCQVVIVLYQIGQICVKQVWWWWWCRDNKEIIAGVVTIIQQQTVKLDQKWKPGA